MTDEKCKYPDEIAYVRGLQRKSTAMWIAAITIVVSILTSVVWVGLSYGALESDVEHNGEQTKANRDDVRKARQDILDQERRTSKQYEVIIENYTKISTKLDMILGGEHGTGNSRDHRRTR